MDVTPKKLKRKSMPINMYILYLKNVMQQNSNRSVKYQLCSHKEKETMSFIAKMQKNPHTNQ